MAHELTRRSAIGGGLALAAGSAVPFRAARSQPTGLAFAGVNLAGAEFGKVPGKVYTDYAYPTRANINYFAQLGFNVIRVPFKWERLQPNLNGDFAPGEQALLKGVVDHAASKGVHIVIDPHNYARRRVEKDGGASNLLIGSEGLPASAFADFWRRLADLFKGRQTAIFNLMNEPYGIAAQTWLGIANAAVQAIRETGAGNLILVPGVAYTGAHSWISSKNTLMAGVVDPGNNFAFDVHQYLDRDSSGTTPLAVSPTIGSQRIKAFQTWARDNRFRGFLGEFGAASDETSLSALNDLCREMEANPDVWLGWTAWAGGGWWPPTYMFNLEPSGGQIRPQTQILAEYASRVHPG